MKLEKKDIQTIRDIQDDIDAEIYADDNLITADYSIQRTAEACMIQRDKEIKVSRIHEVVKELRDGWISSNRQDKLYIEHIDELFGEVLK